MRKFEEGLKINFVDENNVFVGYDMHQDCCEYAGWFVSNEKPKAIAETPDFDFDGFVFDVGFMEDNVLGVSVVDVLGVSVVDEGGSVLFRLVREDNSEAFLCLFNCQNGYYSHGFTVKINGQEIHGGFL